MLRPHGPHRAAAAAIAIALTLAALAGCGSSGSEESEGGSGDSQPSSEAESTSASTAQYASIVAKNSDITDQLETMQSCDWFGSGPLDSEGSIVCMAGVLTLSYQSSTLAVSLDGAAEEAKPAYIGAPPAEIAQLVTDTVKAAKTLELATQALNDNECEQSAEGKCLDLRVGAVKGMNALERELRAWGPYL